MPDVHFYLDVQTWKSKDSHGHTILKASLKISKDLGEQNCKITIGGPLNSGFYVELPIQWVFIGPHWTTLKSLI